MYKERPIYDPPHASFQISNYFEDGRSSEVKTYYFHTSCVWQIGINIYIKYKLQKVLPAAPEPLLTRCLRQCQANRVRLSRVNATRVVSNTIKSFVRSQFVFIFS